MKEKTLNKIESMTDGELVARLQRYSQMIGMADFVAKQETLEELSGLDMAVANEILKRMSIRDGQITSLERNLLDELIRPALGVVGSSRWVDNASAQSLNFLVLLKGIKNLYHKPLSFGQDVRDWNKIISEI